MKKMNYYLLTFFFPFEMTIPSAFGWFMEIFYFCDIKSGNVCQRKKTSWVIISNWCWSATRNWDGAMPSSMLPYHTTSLNAGRCTSWRERLSASSWRKAKGCRKTGRIYISTWPTTTLGWLAARRMCQGHTRCWVPWGRSSSLSSTWMRTARKS